MNLSFQLNYLFKFVKIGQLGITWKSGTQTITCDYCFKNNADDDFKCSQIYKSDKCVLFSQASDKKFCFFGNESFFGKFKVSGYQSHETFKYEGSCSNTTCSINYCKTCDPEDSATCFECYFPFIKTANAQNQCVRVINNCKSYANQKCLACNDDYQNLTLSKSSTYCIEAINHCSSYKDQETSFCEVCNDNYKPTISGKLCVTAIKNCLYYQEQEDSICLMCEQGKIVTDNGLFCVDKIENCISYEDLPTAQCKECYSDNQQNLRPAFDNQQCVVNPIENCKIYENIGE